MIQRAQTESDLDLRIIARGARVQLIDQSRIVQGQAVDRDRHRALVEAKALQHGLQPIEVAPAASDQSERADGRGLAQRQQFGSRLECRVQRAVFSGRHIDAVGLWIRGACRRRCVPHERSQ